MIPLVLQVAAQRRQAITVFGNDYDTPDGTCIRDYVHVQDLCNAHLLALEALLAGASGGTYNLGNGNSYSVAEVIKGAKRLTGRNIPTIYGARRDGDPPRLVANSEKAKKVLEWTPHYRDLDTIICHAWQWEKRYLAKQTVNSE